MNITLKTAKTRSIQARKARFWTMTRRNRRRDHLNRVLIDIRKQREGVLELPPVPQLSPSVKILPFELKAVIEKHPDPTSMPPVIGNWVPKGLKPLINQHYELIANVPITTGYLGDVPIDAATSDFLNRHRISKVGDILALYKFEIQKLEQYRPACLNQVIYALTLVVEIINRTDQTPTPPRIGDWVPEDLWQLVDTHYEIIAELSTSDGHLGNVALGTRVANVFESRGFSKVSDFLNLPEKHLLGLKNFGVTSIRVVANALKTTAEDIENGKLFSAPNLSAKIIHEAFSALPPDQRIAVEMRFGFTARGKTLKQIGGNFEITREAARIKILKALNKIKSPRLKGMRQLIIDTISGMPDEKILLSLEELKETLRERGYLEENDRPLFVPMMHLLDRIFGQYFTYVFVKNGDAATDATKKNIWLVRDFQKYSNVLPYLCKTSTIFGKGKKSIWKFTEYQEMLAQKHGIKISTQELRKIFRVHPEIVIKGDHFFTRDKSKRYLIKKTIQKNGPLHYRKISEITGILTQTANNILVSHDEFVLVGNGIYDLTKNHPELQNIPQPNVKRKSQVFAAIYSILKVSDKDLRPSEILRKLTERGHKWTLKAITRVLTADKKYQNFFVEENGKYKLKTQKD